MPLLVHLSDLHMGFQGTAQSRIFDALVRALEREKGLAPDEPFVVAVTGDVFDSSVLPAKRAVAGFLELHARIVAALGGTAPTIVLPGNHDRRRFGWVAPYGSKLFRALSDAADPRHVFVAGCSPPLLAEVVPGTL